MSNRFRQIAGRVADWSEADQENAAEILLALEAERETPVELSPDDVAALEQSAEDERLARFASDEEVTAIFRRFRS